MAAQNNRKQPPFSVTASVVKFDAFMKTWFKRGRELKQRSRAVGILIISGKLNQQDVKSENRKICEANIDTPDTYRISIIYRKVGVNCATEVFVRKHRRPSQRGEWEIIYRTFTRRREMTRRNRRVLEKATSDYLETWDLLWNMHIRRQGYRRCAGFMHNMRRITGYVSVNVIWRDAGHRKITRNRTYFRSAVKIGLLLGGDGGLSFRIVRNGITSSIVDSFLS